VSQVGHIQSVLARLSRAMRQVSAGVSELSSAQSRDSAAWQSMASSLDTIVDIGKDNATTVSQSFSAKESLLCSADSLSKIVAGMKLPMGSADEALDLVERAARLIQDKGLELARMCMHDVAGEFQDRDLFIVGVDRAGICQLTSSDPSIEGSALPLQASNDGLLLHEALWRAAEGDNKWVEYTAAHPLTLEMETRLAYAKKVSDDLVIMCSLYKDPREA
jgi:hypothetical protein